MGAGKNKLGLGYAESWISNQHGAYPDTGGINGFVGDGKINHKPERLVDLYYSWHVIKSRYLSFDYQYLADPAYIQDRGPVNVYGVRVHFEF